MSAHQRVLEALDAAGCRPDRAQRKWTCPAHEDRTPSLSVKDADKSVLIKCFAGCDTEAVVSALGLTMGDLFDDARSVERSATQRKRTRSRPQESEEPPPPANAKRVAEYLYTDRNGELLRRKVRLEPGSKGRSKAFMWERPSEGGGWGPCSQDGNPHALYALPLVAEAGTIHVGEGEKAADALNVWLAEHGDGDQAATCAPATGWEDGYTETLRGKRVVLWVDRDEPGERQATRVYVALREAGVSVETVRARVPEEKADAFDHLAAGYTPDQAEPFALPLDAEARNDLERVERFSDERTRIGSYSTPRLPRASFLCATSCPPESRGSSWRAAGPARGTSRSCLRFRSCLARSSALRCGRSARSGARVLRG